MKTVLMLICISIAHFAFCQSTDSVEFQQPDQGSTAPYHLQLKSWQNFAGTNNLTFKNKKIDIQPVNTNERNKFYRKKSRLCVLATVGFISLYAVSNDRNNKVAFVSAVSALASSSLGVIYYIKFNNINK